MELEDYLDASTLRPIPDNQEVFVHKTENSSVIVELLEVQGNIDFYFESILDKNDKVNYLYQDEFVIEAQVNNDRIYLKLFRFKDLDVLLTITNQSNSKQIADSLSNIDLSILWKSQ